MHLLLVKTAVAVLSLGTIFLGASSAPTDSSGELVQRVRKPVPDINKSGYVLEDMKTPTGDMGDKWSVSRNNKVCDVLGVDAKKHMMAVAEECNAEDVPTDRIKLRGIILATWTHVTNLKVAELDMIAYKTIQNAEVLKPMDEACDHMLENFKDPKLQNANVTPSHAAAFKELMTGNAFGAGVRKMLDEYEGMENRKVIQIDITRKYSREMTFHLSSVS
jgi:hypothetical protein